MTWSIKMDYKEINIDPLFVFIQIALYHRLLFNAVQRRSTKGKVTRVDNATLISNRRWGVSFLKISKGVAFW